MNLLFITDDVNKNIRYIFEKRSMYSNLNLIYVLKNPFLHKLLITANFFMAITFLKLVQSR